MFGWKRVRTEKIARRLVCFITVFAMAVALTACAGNQETPVESTVETEADTAAETVAETAAETENQEETTAAAVAEEKETEPKQEETDVEPGDEFLFTELATDKNGDNGLTFYYTADGETITPFTKWNEEEQKWYRGNQGVLVYPKLIPADNYGVAGSSEREYVVMGYEIPATGSIELFTWTALQGDPGEHGYHIKIAQNDPKNVVTGYDCIGDTQTVVNETYSVDVKKGETLFLIYEPEVKKDGEWFGYITKITYTSVDGKSAVLDAKEEAKKIEVSAGDELLFTELASDKNGSNGLTFYYTEDGVNLNPIKTRVAEEDKWYHGGQGLLVYPRMNLQDNYGVAGTSEKEYLVMGCVLPASGKIDLYSWIALQGNPGEHGYHVKVALGTPENVLHEYDCIGDTQTAVANDYEIDVEEGQELFITYEPVAKKDGEWFGYITGITYLSVK